MVCGSAVLPRRDGAPGRQLLERSRPRSSGRAFAATRSSRARRSRPWQLPSDVELLSADPQRQDRGFPTTWRVLRQLLASISPSEVFLTNSYVGLPDLEKDTAPFPMTESFRRRCAELLRLQCELFRPRAAVCLGVPAAKLLASLATGLDAWQPWPGYGLLAAADQRLVEGCELGGATFTAVSVQHPSAVISNAERRLDAELIALASALDSC